MEVSCASLSEKITKDLSVNFESNLLRKNLSKLDLCIEVVVGIEVLTEFRTLRHRTSDTTDKDCSVRQP